MALFERRPRKVVLTEAGERLYPVLRWDFDAFDEAVRRLSRRRDRTQVTVSATIALATRWLVPRIAAFRAARPGIDLALDASDEVVDLDAGAADTAIRYGDGDYAGFAMRPLLADRFAPVCSPRLALRSPAGLGERTLIAFDWRRRHPDNPTWTRWFALGRLPEPDTPALLRFSEESHAIQAAVAGQGVALLSLALIRDELAAGLLVEPFGPSIDGFRHHLLTRTGGDDPAIAAVRDWLVAEAEALARV